MKGTHLKLFLKAGVTGMLGLIAFYAALLVAVTGDLRHPLEQFLALQQWMSLLIAGFGIEVGLFWLMKRGVHWSLKEKRDAKVAAGTSSAVSGMAMVACCAHHLVEVLPILGLSAATLFLSEYQKELLAMGVFANLGGIAFMGWMVLGQPDLRTLSGWALSRTRGERA